MGIRWTRPDALAPSAEVAYRLGGPVRVVLALVIVAVVVPAARRLTMPTDLLWLVLALYGAGRLLMFGSGHRYAAGQWRVRVLATPTPPRQLSRADRTRGAARD